MVDELITVPVDSTRTYESDKDPYLATKQVLLNLQQSRMRIVAKITSESGSIICEWLDAGLSLFIMSRICADASQPTNREAFWIIGWPNASLNEQ